MFRGKKIILGYEIKSGPWGGGNQFLISVKKHFEFLGAQVVSHLVDDADIIFIINPNKNSGTFSLEQLNNFAKRNPHVKIVHRINETSKAKGFFCGVNRLRMRANRLSHAVIFISSWVKEYYAKKGLLTKKSYVIHNGPDKNIFNSCGHISWDGETPMKIVTHHWSNNYMKGADIYRQLDMLLKCKTLNKQFSFTYIGNFPKSLRFRNTKVLAPLYGKELADELRKHHIYLTAARWEACGMHQLEGALCGLPVLYINEGGGVVETCAGYGISYSKFFFKEALLRMKKEYFSLQSKINTFPYDSVRMCSLYEEVVKDLLGFNK